jgi:hypothetical protein
MTSLLDTCCGAADFATVWIRTITGSGEFSQTVEPGGRRKHAGEPSV